MFAVVGCRACHAIWIRERGSDTSTCPRCQKRYPTEKLRTLAESESAVEAREARSAMLAARHAADPSAVSGYLELEAGLEDAGISPDAVNEALGLDATEPSTDGAGGGSASSPVDIVREAISRTDPSTTGAVVEHSADRGVPVEKARRMIDRLVAAGQASRSGDRIRLL